MLDILMVFADFFIDLFMLKSKNNALEKIKENWSVSDQGAHIVLGLKVFGVVISGIIAITVLLFTVILK